MYIGVRNRAKVRESKRLGARPILFSTSDGTIAQGMRKIKQNTGTRHSLSHLAGRSSGSAGSAVSLPLSITAPKHHRPDVLEIRIASFRSPIIAFPRAPSRGEKLSRFESIPVRPLPLDFPRCASSARFRAIDGKIRKVMEYIIAIDVRGKGENNSSLAENNNDRLLLVTVKRVQNLHTRRTREPHK